MSGLVWLALDGVGHPSDAPPGSPWEADAPTLRGVIDAGLALDARLGVEGLPQSATGQASWLTGENAALVMNGHFGPRPGPTLRAMLERSLPVRLARAGGRVELLNFYPPAYFGRSRFPHGCFPLSILLAGRELNPAGFPLVAPPLGLSFEAPHVHGMNLSLDEVRRLGETVGESAAHLDLLILDLWFSDYLGHQGTPAHSAELDVAARAYLARLDALLHGLLQRGTPVIITSDHGNFENLRVKSHTLARVPFASANLPLPAPAAPGIVAAGQALAATFGL